MISFLPFGETVKAIKKSIEEPTSGEPYDCEKHSNYFVNGACWGCAKEEFEKLQKKYCDDDISSFVLKYGHFYDDSTMNALMLLSALSKKK